MQQAEWDIVTGVGITALGVAAGRAMETCRQDALVSDPYAEAFVRAAAPPVPMPTRIDDDTDPDIPWSVMATYTGVRSRYFDEYFADASAAGVRQVVLLAAGLDVRAYRLDWPAGTVVYELDAPKVLGFKDGVLSDRGATPRAERRTVAVDLREDWANALRERDFDVSRPTAWLAEGLLPFLPNEAKDSVFRRVHELSARGSRIAAEHVDDVGEVLKHARFHDMSVRFGVDMRDLWPDQEDYRPADWLTEHGWAVDVVRAAEVAARYGRALDNWTPDPAQSSQLITAHRGDGAVA
ncbi:SAM-dependent methyltransferase [Rhodococcus spelaei]|uniref:S-adenosyl-L-methionine-dependent methyltransferase n=1 Tax=Rhodococcus spelaei TaxID=2546320 RepID=A0A541B3T9_9NOCA|nr:SAM-dependent methyltransferase [Rhodococcus spelaei]TQF66971.1 SAM-dependent methyltransferase [Rhodococcus spelaei]